MKEREVVPVLSLTSWLWFVIYGDASKIIIIVDSRGISIKELSKSKATPEQNWQEPQTMK